MLDIDVTVIAVVFLSCMKNAEQRLSPYGSMWYICTGSTLTPCQLSIAAKVLKIMLVGPGRLQFQLHNQMYPVADIIKFSKIIIQATYKHPVNKNFKFRETEHLKFQIRHTP